jgi:prepilin-type N-terminal cleavage/methylation domain-containing protein
MRKSGFTLIELMVVIAIIGILSAIVLAKLSTARLQARDGKRVSDIGQLQFALEGYFQASPRLSPTYPPSTYDNPSDTTWESSLQAGDYITTFFTDPSTNNQYDYQVCTDASNSKCYDNQSYCIGANLENANNAAIKDNVSCPAGYTSWCTLSTTGHGNNNPCSHYFPW